MKVSSLNKFKGKEVDVEFRDAQTGMATEYVGIVDDVEAENITIELENGLIQIPIPDLISITISKPDKEK